MIGLIGAKGAPEEERMGEIESIMVALAVLAMAANLVVYLWDWL